MQQFMIFSLRHTNYYVHAMFIIWLLVLVETGCGTHTADHPPQDPRRYQGLPSEPKALVSYADGQVAHHPHSLSEVDRALAALELALEKHPLQPSEVLWRASRACFLMTDIVEDINKRIPYAKQGKRYAEEALQVTQNKKVEPYYYLALNLGKLAEATRGLKLLSPIIAAAERSVVLDPKYDNAGALRLLGKMYLSAPAWPVSVGSTEKAVMMLERAVAIAPIPLNRIFLAEAYFHDEQYAKAKNQLCSALSDIRIKELDRRWQKEAEDYLRRTDQELSDN